MTRFSHLRVALVHYWFIRPGGAEKMMDVLGEMFPQADLFTLLAVPGALPPSLRERRIFTSPLQRLPGFRHYHRALLPFYPLALERFDLSGYDLVISSESGPAKGVLTGADSCHICYCHTPMRYLWEMPGSYRRSAPGGPLGRGLFSLASHYVRTWDYAAAGRVDHFIANSQNVALRIRKHYGRDSEVIYPPVEVTKYRVRSAEEIEDYYLILSRLVDYKRIDLAIAACAAMNRHLVIIGEGEDRARLQRLAGPQVSFLGALPESEVRRHLRHCRALLFPGEEDFGLVPVEAQASGCPVIAYGRGGALETVTGASRMGASGVFFYEQNPSACAAAMREFEHREVEFSPTRIHDLVLRFDTSRFREQMTGYIAACLGQPKAIAASQD